MAAKTMQTALKNLADQLGVGDAEIFPKQTKLDIDREDVGNWMVMPYYGDTYDAKLKEQVGLRKTGAELTTDQFLDAAEAGRVDPAELVRVAEAHPGSTRKTKLIGGSSTPLPDVPFSDGPPCFEALAAKGIQEPGRNNTLLNIGAYLKKKGSPIGRTI